MKTLRKMKKGEKATVVKVTADQELGRRIRDLGIIPGSTIQVIGQAPLFDPVAIRVNDSTLTLRNNEADFIFVTEEG